MRCHMPSVLIGAAQYIRMSTEHQQYSLENQKAAICEYASKHGMTVVKTYDGKRRLALLGFRMGGRPGYGLRRILVSTDGKRKQKLAPGQYKYTSTDRVLLVPGPKKETEQVREIYAKFLRGQTLSSIAR